MSFVNLMGNDTWTEEDIVARTQALIRSEFSAEAENILNRKVTGAAIGQYKMTPSDLAEVARYTAVCDQVRELGNQARADVLVLAEVFAMEAADRKAAQAKAQAEAKAQALADAQENAEPGAEPDPAAGAALEGDVVASDEEEVQEPVVEPSEAALALYKLRNPEPPPAEMLPAEMPAEMPTEGPEA
jgi:hypothetical protein